MSWLTITNRKEELVRSINNYEVDDLSISRQLSATERTLLHEQSKDELSEQAEIKEAGKEYETLRDQRPVYSDYDSNGNLLSGKTGYKGIKTYSEASSQWNQDYNDAKEEYDELRTEIENAYDEKQEDREQEATLVENNLQVRQTKIEANLESLRNELETITKQISTDVKNSAVSFGD